VFCTGVPLHVMFPQPWFPTKAFPHPLACLSYENSWCDQNYYSYDVVESLMWLSIEGSVNNFRKNVLKLEPIRWFGESTVCRYVLMCESDCLDVTL
jgi:sterol 3beta-glucosyltransferase